MTHKFRCGDLVYVEVKDKCMSHFKTNFIGRLCGSYADQYGGGPHEEKMFAVCYPGNTSAWYYTHQFTLLKKGSDSDAYKCLKRGYRWRPEDAELAKEFE